MTPKSIVEKSLKIGGDIFVFTNGNGTIEVLDGSQQGRLARHPIFPGWAPRPAPGYTGTPSCPR